MSDAWKAGLLRLSVLDLSPVPSGSPPAKALRNTLDLARHTDGLGYHRYWLAEHHNSGALACTVPEILIGHVAGITQRLRVGSGGVMLPNHAPLKVAETFRVLEALHPDRIDLGLGRAPGTDVLTALALRQSGFPITADDFPEQLTELLGFLRDDLPAGHRFRSVVAEPHDAGVPEVWLLGATGFSAQKAAELGLAFAFAHHINPGAALEALALYRAQFRPSAWLATPRALVSVAAICADTEEVAFELAGSSDLLGLQLHRNPRAPLPSVAEAAAYPYTAAELEHVCTQRERLFAGSPGTVREELSRFAGEAGVEEIMVLTLVHEHAARLRSYTLLAEAFGLKTSAGQGTKPEHLDRGEHG